MTTEAQKRANYKYKNETKERVNCYFDIGTKEAISSLGYSCNSFVRLAVEEKIARERLARK